MVTVKRQKKRSMINPTGKYWLIAGAVAIALVLAIGVIGLVSRARIKAQMDELGEYMAKSIRTDLNQTLQCYNTLERKNDTAAEQLENMKKYMYSAYNMNKILVETRGSAYSILDITAYNAFQTTVGEYERLLETGQATTSIKTSLSDCMQALETTLSTRFDSADLLLPRQVSR